jgi:hypothetical protein
MAEIRGPIYLCIAIFSKMDLKNKYRKRSRFRVKTTHFGSGRIGDDKRSDDCLHPYPKSDPVKYSLPALNIKDGPYWFLRARRGILAIQNGSDSAWRGNGAAQSERGQSGICGREAQRDVL